MNGGTTAISLLYPANYQRIHEAGPCSRNLIVTETVREAVAFRRWLTFSPPRIIRFTQYYIVGYADH